MKLLRWGPKGCEKPGALDPRGRIRDLSGIIEDIGPSILKEEILAQLRAVNLARLPEVPASERLGVPIAGVGKFLGVGLNYASHAVDSHGNRASEPTIFTKAISCLNGPGDDIVLPRHAQKPDWEVELGVVIGRTARYVEVHEAMECVCGYVLVNDVSDRGFQNASGQWDKGKGCDTFGPVGPWLVTADEIADPQNLDLWLQLNGRTMQQDNTRNMIFPVAALISNISSYITLNPGDIIATGTPRGVGADQKPEPRFLQPGDVLTLGVDGLGTQRQKVVAWPGPSRVAVMADALREGTR
jgi:2-keto-4-pentenoate hydratase/2-oxohepta-3-ene-1,7-dioic acid hydratase in catechol pathway